MKWLIKTFEELSLQELYAILQLRAEVFVVEQLCTYQDMDEHDKDAWHVMAYDENQLVAYARLIKPGLVYPTASLGRVIVKKEFRGKQIGKELMERALLFLKEKVYKGSVTISAQCYLLKFYSDLGFKTEGNEYLEDNIPHIKMILHR